MRYLAIVLLAPWLAILGWAYWAYPKRLPRHARRRSFDVLALLLAPGLAAQAALLGFDGVAPPSVDRFGRASGAIWQQVLPALYGYGAYLGVLAIALGLRQRWFGGGRR